MVSGMTSTDHWLICKHYPVDKKYRELKIVESTINKQQFAYYTKPEGGTEKVMLEEKGKEACFTEEEACYTCLIVLYLGLQNQRVCGEHRGVLPATNGH